MYVLHWEYMAGSIVVQALLQDADVAFEARYVDMGSGEHKKPDYQSINPTGRVPALTLPNAKTIGETGAIVTYLCETYPDAGLSPRPGDADRPEFLLAERDDVDRISNRRALESPGEIRALRCCHRRGRTARVG